MESYEPAQNPAQNALIKLTDFYQHNPVIRPLLQLLSVAGFSVGAALDSLIGNSLALYKEHQYRQFFDAILNTGLVLTEEMVQENDFIHSYYATARAALNTRRREKVELFADLLAKYTANFESRDQDRFEENLAILDDLSFTEFQLLMILYRHQKTWLPGPGAALHLANKFWDDFARDAEAEIAIDGKHLPGALARLNRTGLYQTITGSYLGYTGDQGLLTWNFYQFLKAFSFEASDSAEVSDSSPGQADPA